MMAGVCCTQGHSGFLDSEAVVILSTTTEWQEKEILRKCINFNIKRKRLWYYQQ
jgi:hypothetical protein